MKSFIYSLVLFFALSVGNSLFAQDRGAGAGGGRIGAPVIPTRPEPASNRPSPSDTDRGKSSTNASATSDARKAQGTQDPSIQLAKNSGLSTQMAKFFPQGTDLGAQASGFKNLGQFVAAVHASKNLEVPFDQLRTKMVTDGDSLNDAIHELKPELTENAVKTETKKAEDQAKKDLDSNKA
jgi:hypothetical protein